MTEVWQRPLRSDAERNRRLVLEAAAQAFAEEGFDVGMAEIARRAGVGNATVFRRFPSKDALYEAIVDEKIAELCAAATLAAELTIRGMRSSTTSRRAPSCRRATAASSRPPSSTCSSAPS